MTSACYLCAEPTSTGVFVHDATRTRPNFRTIACSRCGLIQHETHPSPEEIAAYYSSGDYRREFPPLPTGGVMPGGAGYDAMRAAWAAQLIDAAECSVGSVRGRPAYEVGAGDCAVSAELRRRGASPVIAVEIDPTIVPDGVEVVPALPDTLDSNALLFAFQVIEHQTDVVATIASWLRADTVYMEMPNAWRPYTSLTHFLQYPHLVTFCPRTIVLACMMAGAEEVAYEESGTILAVRARGNAGRRSFEDASSRFVAPYDGAQAAAQLRGAFGL